MSEYGLHIIMPVKDSVDTAERAIRAIIGSGYTLTVYNDNSTAENTNRLTALAEEMGFTLRNLSEMTDHPSPNYRLVLQTAQKEALEDGAHLVIIESDVIVKEDTIARLHGEVDDMVGMVAAVTEDTAHEVNFPYEYARRWKKEVVDTKKRFSFCCTLLTHAFLGAYSFEELDPTKNWYDVTISHKSTEMGYRNLLMMNNPVLHMPHSSRPWKQLKYTNPLLYYWRKLTQHKDKI